MAPKVLARSGGREQVGAPVGGCYRAKLRREKRCRRLSSEGGPASFPGGIVPRYFSSCMHVDFVKGKDHVPRLAASHVRT